MLVRVSQEIEQHRLEIVTLNTCQSKSYVSGYFPESLTSVLICETGFKSCSDADIRSVVEHGKRVKLYPLGGDPDSTVFVDAYDKPFDATIPYDATFFELLDRFVRRTSTSAPKAPAGKESNWVPTDPKRRFELLFRLYGPKKELLDKTWKLPDVEEVK